MAAITRPDLRAPTSNAIDRADQPQLFALPLRSVTV